MRISEEYKRLLYSKGIPLTMLGVGDIALKRDDTLQAVGFLRAAEIPTLGGDVYFRRGSRIEPAYANWHADRKKEEDRDTYLRRSWNATERYVEEFPANEGCRASVFFSDRIEMRLLIPTVVINNSVPSP